MNNFSFASVNGLFKATSADASVHSDVWCHFERSNENSDAIRALGVAPNDTESLLDETTRPHFYQINESSILLFLRAINLNPDSDPEDMVSLRFWFDGSKLITITNRDVQAVKKVNDHIQEQPDALPSARHILLDIISQIILRIEKHVAKLSDKMEKLEENNDIEQKVNQSELHDLRRATSRLRRFMYPQLEALKKLAVTDLGWQDKKLKHSLKDFVGSMKYYNEEIALINERCEILSNEVSGKLTERVNRNLYIISIITVIFLPLSFVTGLLGINVGGIPAASSTNGFVYVSLIVFGLLLLQLLVLKLYRWF